MTKDQKRLAEAGEALFGPNWQSALGRAINVSDRTVRRWVAGDNIPDGIWPEIANICRDHATRLLSVAEKLA